MTLLNAAEIQRLIEDLPKPARLLVNRRDVNLFERQARLLIGDGTLPYEVSDTSPTGIVFLFERDCVLIWFLADNRVLSFPHAGRADFSRKGSPS